MRDTTICDQVSFPSLLCAPTFQDFCLLLRGRSLQRTVDSRVDAHGATRAAVSGAHRVSAKLLSDCHSREQVTRKKKRRTRVSTHTTTSSWSSWSLAGGHRPSVYCRARIRARIYGTRKPPRTASTFHHGGSATDRATTASNRRPPAKVVPRAAETANPDGARLRNSRNIRISNNDNRINRPKR